MRLKMDGKLEQIFVLLISTTCRVVMDLGCTMQHLRLSFSKRYNFDPLRRGKRFRDKNGLKKKKEEITPAAGTFFEVLLMFCVWLN